MPRWLLVALALTCAAACCVPGASQYYSCQCTKVNSAVTTECKRYGWITLCFPVVGIATCEQVDCNCAPGKYLKDSGIYPAIGSVMNTGFASCDECGRGTYQPAVSHEEDQCFPTPAGRYTSTTGMGSATPCPKGAYCEAGSVAFTRCPSGTFNNERLGKSLSACKFCPAGYQCPSPYASATPCPAGKFSEGGLASCSACPTGGGVHCNCATAGIGCTAVQPCGSAAVYCPAGEGSKRPRVVPAGYYSHGGSSALYRSRASACPSGSYCSSGVQTLCPAGRFGQTVPGQPGPSTPQCSGQCTGGYFCAAGSTSAAPTPCANAAIPPSMCDSTAGGRGVKCYCPPGTQTVRVVDDGYYSIPTGAAFSLTRTGQARCEASKYELCEGGVILENVVWADECADGATRSVDENAAVGTAVSGGDDITASDRFGRSVSYNIVTSEALTAGCSLEDAFRLAGARIEVSKVGIDFEACRAFAVTVRATAGSDSATCRVHIDVRDVNEAPEMRACGSREVFAGQPAGSLVEPAFTADDPDLGQALSFSLVGDAGPFEITSCGGLLILHEEVQYDSSIPGVAVTVRVSDSGPDGGLSAECASTVYIRPSNSPPILRDATYSVDEGSPVGAEVGFLDVFDPDFDTLTFSVSRPDSPDAFYVDAQGVLRVKERVLDFEDQNHADHEYVLDVQTDDGLSAADATVVVAILDRNDAPVVSVSGPASVPEDAITGTRVGDPVGASDVDVPSQQLTFSIEDGSETPFEVNADSGQVYVRAGSGGAGDGLGSGLNYEAVPSYTLLVVVSDGIASSTGALAISVTDANEAPLIAAGTRGVYENSTFGDPVPGVVVADDPDAYSNQVLLFSLLTHTDRFAIDSLSGQLVVVGALDHESEPTINVSVQVVDSGQPRLPATAVIAIDVHDANDAPRIANTDPLHVEENKAGVTVGSILVHDDDGTSDSFTLDIVAGNARGIFELDGDSLRTVSEAAGGRGADYEAANEHNLRIAVVDEMGLRSTAVVSIMVVDRNEPPHFLSDEHGGPLQRVIREKLPAGHNVGSPLLVQDPDAGDVLSFTLHDGECGSTFDIDDSGQLLVGAAPLPSVEQRSAPYQCTVRVTDAEGLFSEGAVTVVLTDVNDAPVFTAPAFELTVDENSPAGTRVGAPVTATDPDAGQTATLRYSLLDDGVGIASAFSVHAQTGQVTVSPGAALDHEARESWELRIAATDSPSTGPSMSTAVTVTVTVADVNEHPLYETDVYTFSVNENSGIGVVVGSLTADDIDSGDVVSYAISAGNTGGAFAINATNGEFLVANAVLDYESVPVYSVSVRATDSGGLSSTAAVKVVLRDQNDPPVISTPASQTVRESATSGAIVGYVAASDEDEDSVLVYAITGGNDGGAFVLDSNTGELSVAHDGALDYEKQAQFELTLLVVDNAAASDVTTWRLEVEDVNEAPWIVGPAIMSLAENPNPGAVVGVVLGDDADIGDDDKLQWAIVGGNEASAFAIDARSGTVSVNNPAPVDYEALASVSWELPMSIRCTDPRGLSHEAPLVVSVVDVNEAPHIQDVDGSIAEDVSGDGPWVIRERVAVSDQDFGQTYTLSVVGGDAASQFSFTGRSLLLVNRSGLDAETTASYELILSAVDSGTPPLSSTRVFTVHVTDRNERPVLVDATRTIAENSAASARVGVAIPSNDPDLLMRQSLFYQVVGGNGTALFKIDPCSGQLSVADGAFLDHEAVDEYVLRIRVTDDGGDVPGPPRLSADATVSVAVTDVNESPRLVGASAASVEENSPAGTHVLRVEAVDDDTDPTDVLRYAIVGGNTNAGSFSGEAFSIDAATGDILVQQDVLNYEATPSYKLEIEVSDQGFDRQSGEPAPLKTRGYIRVTILDVDEPPEFDQRSLSHDVRENAPEALVVGTVAAADPDTFVDDAEAVQYALIGGSGAQYFSIVRDGDFAGLLSVAAAGAEPGVLDFENPAASNYTLLVGAAGPTGDPTQPGLNGTSTATVHVTVTDVNEPPLLAPQVRHVDEHPGFNTFVGSPLHATDPEGNQLTFLMSLEGKQFVDITVDGQIFVVGGISKTYLDYESLNFAGVPPAIDHTLSVSVLVTDGTSTTTGSVAIVLRDIAEPPVVMGFPVATQLAADASVAVAIASRRRCWIATIPENSLANTTVNDDLVAVDRDAGDTVTFSMSAKGCPRLPSEVPLAGFKCDWTRGRQVASQLQRWNVPTTSDIGHCDPSSDNALFSIDPATGRVFVSPDGARPGRLNFEGARQSFSLYVTATDSTGLSRSIFMAVAVVDVPEPPVWVDKEGVPLREPASGSDDTEASSLRFSVPEVLSGGTLVTPRLDAFVMDPETDLERAAAAPQQQDSDNGPAGLGSVGDADILGNGGSSGSASDDVEEGWYSFDILAGADRYTRVDPHTLDEEVVVLDEGSEPLFDVDGHAAEAPQTPVGGLGAFGSFFNTPSARTGVGRLTVFNPDDDAFRYPNYMELLVRACDTTSSAHGGPRCSKANITVSIADSNRPPYFDIASNATELFMVENVPINTLLFDVAGSDDDQSQFLNYTISDNRWFKVVSTPGRGNANGDGDPLGVGAVHTAVVVDYEEVVHDVAARVNSDITFTYRNEVRIRITATDWGPSPLFQSLSSATTYSIYVIDVNEAPSWKELRTGASRVVVPETTSGGSTPVGTEFVLGILCEDPDVRASIEAWNMRRYSMFSEANSTVSASLELTETGRLRVVAPVDYEALTRGARLNHSNALLAVTVVCEDDGDPPLSDTYDLTVVVEDVNEEPSLTLKGFAPVPESSTPGTYVGSLDLVDVDDNTGIVPYTFRLVDPLQRRYFDITQEGVLLVSSGRALDFEDQDSFSVVIEITNHHRSADDVVLTREVLVSVSDVNDLTLDSISVLGVISTTGGVPVKLRGTNMGPTPAKQARQGVTAGEVDISVAYGPRSNPELYAPTSCTLDVAGAGNTAIECIMAPGVGRDLVWTLRVGQWTAPPSDVTVSYAPPELTHIEGASDMPTQGGAVVTLRGRNFGPPTSGSRAAVSAMYTYVGGDGEPPRTYRAVGCVVMSHSTAQCTSVAGIGASLEWVLVVGGQQSAALAGSAETGLAGYVAPVLLNVTQPQRLDTRGGQQVYVHGRNFGPFSNGASIAGYGNVDDAGIPEIVARGCAVLSQETIVCTTAVGVGADLNWLIRIGGQVAAAESAWRLTLLRSSYEPPQVSELVGDGVRGGSTRGGSVFIVVGNYFASAAQTGALVVQYGPKDTIFPERLAELRTDAFRAVCSILSHTALACETEPGAGRDLWLRVTLAGQSSAPFDAGIRYDSPVVVDYSRDTTGGNGGDSTVMFDTRGSELVTLVGRNFGPADAANIGIVVYGTAGNVSEYEATSCRVVEDHVRIACLTAAGAGADLSWVVAIAGQPSVSPTMSYSPPQIESFSGVGAQGGRTEGGERVFIHGHDFGPAQHSDEYLDAVSYGVSGVEYDVTDSCVVESHHLLKCVTAPGVGTGLRWLITIRGQTSELSEATTSYAPPVIEALWPDGRSRSSTGEVVMSLPTSGEVGGQPVWVRIIGSNFGTHLRDGGANGKGTLQVVFDSVALPAAHVRVFDESWEESSVSCSDALNGGNMTATHTQFASRENNTGVTVVTETAVISAADAAQQCGTQHLSGDWIVVTRETRHLQRVEFMLPRGEGARHTVEVRSVGGNLEVMSNAALLDYASPVLDGVTTIAEVRNDEKFFLFELFGRYFGQNPTVFVVDVDADAPLPGDEPAIADDADIDAPFRVADGFLFDGRAFPPLFLACNETSGGDDFMTCLYRASDNNSTINEASNRGALYVTDPFGRASEVREFSVLSPLVPDSLLQEQLGARLFDTSGGVVLQQEALNLGSSTTITVDGLMCANTPDNGGAAEPFLAVTDLRQPGYEAELEALRLSVGDAAFEANTDPGLVRCVVPPGYYQGSPDVEHDGVSVVLWNGHQPSPEMRIRYKDPVIESVSYGVDDGGGGAAVVSVTTGGTRVVVHGSNFGSLADVDAACRDPRMIDLDRCASSTQCEVYTSGGASDDGGSSGDTEVLAQGCRARCGLPSCPEPLDESMPLGSVFAHTHGGGFYRFSVSSWSHDRIVATTSPGTGKNLRVAAQLFRFDSDTQEGLPRGQATAQTEFMVSYAAPRVTRVSIIHPGTAYDGLGGALALGPTTGGHSIAIEGEAFGDPAGYPLSRIRGPIVDICNRTDSACRPCAVNVTSSSDTLLVCRVPAWVGAGHFVRVTTGLSAAGSSGASVNEHAQANADTAGTPANYGYKAPHIDALSPRNASTNSQVNVTLEGTNFGAPEEPIEVYVRGVELSDALSPSMQRIGRRAVVLNRSHTRVVFKLPVGFGAFNEVYVRVGGQESNKQLFSYNPPVIDAVLHASGSPLRDDCCNGPTLGGEPIIVRGSSFGRFLLGVDGKPVHRVLFSTWQNRGVAIADGTTGVVQPLADGTYADVDYVADGYPEGWAECRNYEFPVDPDVHHTEIRCETPPGLGRDLQLRVFVGTLAAVPSGGTAVTQRPFHVPPQVSNPWSYHYDPPRVSFASPAPNPNGGAIRWVGHNFGDGVSTGSSTNITISGAPCGDVQQVVDLNSVALDCVTPLDTVGPKNVTLVIAEQETHISADHSVNLALRPPQLFHYRALCHANFYGREGEHCTACPTGAVCGWVDFDRIVETPSTEDPYNEPYALPGFYRVDLPVSEDALGDGSLEACVEEHIATRAEEGCPVFFACEPNEACTGRNECADAYLPGSERCSLCNRGFYRMDNECIPCPDNMWILVLGFIFGVTCVGVAGYFLTRKHVNLAFLSIGVDYFQVLAMFARSKVRWPALIKKIFQLMSIFNINLDLTAPECAIPDLSYTTKWSFVMALPVSVAALSAVSFFALAFHKRFVLGRRRRTTAHGATLFGSFTISCYYLYLYVTRTILDVFNCNPTDPSDGKEYLAVVFEPCGEPGGVQVTLLPWALVCFVAYAMGFPAGLGAVFYKHRADIVEDQVSRAYGIGGKRGDSRSASAYDVRKRYHKLYYHFRPQYFWWKLVVIARKLLVAFTSLMFRKNVSFQLAMVLLVLILSYSLQMRYRPFMSMRDHGKVVKEHEAAVAAGDPVARLIRDNLAHLEREKQLAKKRRRNVAERTHSSPVARFLIDYNTVESTLLYCAVLVTICGLMFQSGQLEDDRFAAQREMLTIAVLLVILISIIYFFTVFALEVYVSCFPQHAARLQSRLSRRRFSRKETKSVADAAAPTHSSGMWKAPQDADASAAPTDRPGLRRGGRRGAGPRRASNRQRRVSTVNLTTNEAFGVGALARAAMRRAEADANRAAEAKAKRVAQVEAKRAAHAEAKRAAEAAAGGRSEARTRTRSPGGLRGGGGGDRDGERVALLDQDDGDAWGGFDPADVVDGTDDAEMQAALRAVQQLPPGWVAMQQEATGAVYYHNADTGEDSWVHPSQADAGGAVLTDDSYSGVDDDEDDAADADAAELEAMLDELAAELPEGIEPMLQEGTGLLYFHNTRTGEDTWHVPT